ncbi:dirigent protein 22-like [Gastrolobium bilobum]|uniref:dirigent protein 22-like n=1 Tax=Gastrolobium bilobum TaxID=150636 RepID=UPI002AB1AC63|nr:dirigent protein 22-like [Gastrolobium bilobum]
MVTQYLIFFLLLSSYTLTSVSTEETGFVRSLDREMMGMEKKKNFSQFRFYWQDIVVGNNVTSVAIVPPLPKYNPVNAFGLVRIFDNALTLGPELSSKLVGRAEGFYASTSPTQLDFLVVMSFALFEGRYNGSSITIAGRDVVSNTVREMPVIGGSGVFRFSTGYAEARTHFFDPKTDNAVLEFNVYVFHY